MSRKAVWTEESAIAALRAFRDAHGRPPQETELHRVTETGLPNVSVLIRVFGSAANAYVEAFGDAPSKDSTSKDDDTAEVVRRLGEGATLAELGRERGISGQALGRRVRRYKEVYDQARPR